MVQKCSVFPVALHQCDKRSPDLCCARGRGASAPCHVGASHKAAHSETSAFTGWVSDSVAFGSTSELLHRFCFFFFLYRLLAQIFTTDWLRVHALSFALMHLFGQLASLRYRFWLERVWCFYICSVALPKFILLWGLIRGCKKKAKTPFCRAFCFKSWEIISIKYASKMCT